MKNHGENEAGRLVSDLFLIFKKALDEAKASGLKLRVRLHINEMKSLDGMKIFLG